MAKGGESSERQAVTEETNSALTNNLHQHLACALIRGRDLLDHTLTRMGRLSQDAAS